MDLTDDVMADAIGSLTRAVRDLGNGNAATEMGALEALGRKLEDCSLRISDSLDAIARALQDIATAIDSQSDSE